MTDKPEFFTWETLFFQRLRDAGYAPETVYDIGASDASWSHWIATHVWPEARYELFEPLVYVAPSYATYREWHLGRMARARFHPIGLGAANGTAGFARHAEAVGSSFLGAGPDELPATATRIDVPVRRLDDYAAEQGLPPPSLVKADVQGFELEALKGGERTIQAADLLFLETWFYRAYGEATPLLTELTAWLEPRGFTLVDLGDSYNGEGHKLFSRDAVFMSRAMQDRLGPHPEVWVA